MLFLLCGYNGACFRTKVPDCRRNAVSNLEFDQCCTRENTEHLRLIPR